MSGCRLMVRRRLLELMAERWSRRVVCIVGGPGFGKSVLLAQAAEENRIDRRGTDLFVACGDADGSPASFLRRLGDAVERTGGGNGSTPIGPEPFLAELARRWPGGTCVVIDDVHHLVATSDGARLLRRLIDVAPPSVHFTLAGRRGAPGLGGLRANDELLDIGEDELRLCPTERAELARRWSTHPATLASTGGWPAMAAIAASCGLDRAREYQRDVLHQHLDGRHRRLLAVAAALGPSDLTLLRSALRDVTLGDDEVDRLADLPLVARRDGALIVHEAWYDVVGGALGATDRRDAVARAAAVLSDRREYDRGRQLCADHGLWDDAGRVLRACCARGHADVRSDVLVRWLDELPPERWDDNDGLLLRGIVGRLRDPFSTRTAAVLEQAVERHRAEGDVVGEVAAINELAFVLRNQGRGGEVMGLVVRAAELHAAGHRGVEGLLAMARSVCAEMAGDVRGIVDALDAAPGEVLSRDWLAMFEFRRTIGHLTSGDEHRMLHAAAACAGLAGESTLRHVLPLARWYAGDPQPAIDALDAVIADADRSQVDAVALGAFATMVLASTGRLDAAAQRLAVTELAARGGPVVPMMRGYVVGIRALVAAAHGDDAAARAELESALADAPLTDAVGWLGATRWLALAYVLVPAARLEIDAADLGPLHARRVSIARLVVAARSGGVIDERAAAAWTAQEISTVVPLPWAMELAARLHTAGQRAGLDLAAWYMDRLGRPVRDALRAVGTHGDAALAAGARKLLAAVPLAPEPVAIGVLGPTVLELRGHQAPGPEWQRERVRSLLVYLVLHGPSAREAITDALWPDLDPPAADRNLRVTLSYLQRVLEPDRRKGEAPFLLRQEGTKVVLAGSPHVSLDLAAFEHLVEQALDAHRRGVPSTTRELLHAAVELWRGSCLADVAYEEWAQPTRQAVTERFTAAAVHAAELSLAAGDTAAARRDARRALSVDEWSEPAHRILISAALADDDHVGASRSAANCADVLADLGVGPSAATMELVRRLRAAPAASVA